MSWHSGRLALPFQGTDPITLGISPTSYYRFCPPEKLRDQKVLKGKCIDPATRRP